MDSEFQNKPRLGEALDNRPARQRRLLKKQRRIPLPGGTPGGPGGSDPGGVLELNRLKQGVGLVPRFVSDAVWLGPIAHSGPPGRADFRTVSNRR